jgi:hypothetical protein
MSTWEYFDSRAKRLGIVDTKLAQGGAMFLALVIAKLVPQILSVNVWWFVGLGILCAIKPTITFFGGDSRVAPRRQGA